MKGMSIGFGHLLRFPSIAVLISDIVSAVIQLVRVIQCNFETLVACQRMTYVLKMAWYARLILTSSLPYLERPFLVR
jgi:hypothetical protein